MSNDSNNDTGDGHANAKRLADLMREQQELVMQIGTIDSRIKSIRSQCVEVMNEILREDLPSVLRNGFSDLNWKGSTKGPSRNPVDRRAQMTELLNSYFSKILERFDDPVWKLQAPKQFRGYLITAIRHSLIDILRRKKQKDIGEDAVATEFQQVILNDFESQLQKDRIEIDPETILLIIEEWSNSQDEELKLLARIVSSRYLSERKMKQIAEEFGKSENTIRKQIHKAFAMIRKRINTSE